METILTTPKRTIALFPGAFRPPHEAHFAAVWDLAQRPEVDEVVVIIANRSRLIPGTAKALDADAAREVWSIYRRHLPKVHVEVAAHSAIDHALGYFDRVAAGDTLLFCIGEADLGRGDERFEDLQVLSDRTGVIATVVPAPTGALQVRATTLRATLADGEAGRPVFMAALPACLSADERAGVWSICHSRLREMSEVIQEKVRRLIGCQESAIAEFHCVNQGKADPLFRAHLCNGRTLFVKYAGDTVEAGSIGESLTPKPRKRLAVERRAINCLRANQDWWEREDTVEIPEVVHFDKATLTLVLSEVCLGGQPLQAQLEAALFAVKTAQAVSRCLAAWHGMATQVVPLWGDEEADRKHWQRMLALRTIDIPNEILSHPLQCAVASLQRQSEQASARGFYHLDFCPKNILVACDHSGVIDLELSASVGDPAYDFGILLGHYLLWGLCTASSTACGLALQEAMRWYRQEIGDDRWLKMGGRVVAFAGTTLLDNLARDRRGALQSYAPQLRTTAAALLCKGLAGMENAELIMDAAITRQLQ